jgi:hypothetical protein
MAARVLSSARSRLVTGRVKRLLAGIRVSCRDDSDLFFAIFLLDGVHDEQDNQACRKANGVPALLAVYYSLHVRNSARVFEYSGSGLKRYTVFSPVKLVLALIPDENHGIQNSIAFLYATAREHSPVISRLLNPL